METGIVVNVEKTDDGKCQATLDCHPVGIGDDNISAIENLFADAKKNGIDIDHCAVEKVEVWPQPKEE